MEMLEFLTLMFIFHIVECDMLWHKSNKLVMGWKSWQISLLALLYRLDEFPCYTSDQFNFHCSMARFFSRNFVNSQAFSVNAASKLLCTWDFNITNEKAVKLQQKNLLTQIKVQTTGGTKLMCMSHSVRDLVVHTNLCVHIQVSGRVTQVC